MINDGYTIDEIYDAVNFLSEYLHNNPNKKYKSHYKAIKDWVFTAMEERELKAQEIELKKQELAQRQERINQIDEKQKLVLASNGKRLCDLTQTEYEEYIQSQKPSGNKTIYNWLEKVEVEI